MKKAAAAGAAIVALAAGLAGCGGNSAADACSGHGGLASIDHFSMVGNATGTCGDGTSIYQDKNLNWQNGG